MVPPKKEFYKGSTRFLYVTQFLKFECRLKVSKPSFLPRWDALSYCEFYYNQMLEINKVS